MTSELLREIMDASQGHQEGSLGPVSWQTDYFFDKKDLPSSYAKIRMQIFGKSLVDTVLDLQNPKMTAEKEILGFDVAVELGIDMEGYYIYYQINISGFSYRHVILCFPVS